MFAPPGQRPAQRRVVHDERSLVVPSARYARPRTAFPEAFPDDGPPVIVAPTPVDPLAWGVSIGIKALDVSGQPNWQEGVEKPVTSIDKMTPRHRVPQVQNLVLSASGWTSAMQDSVFRWVLQFGAGGGSTILKFDANGTQQVSVSSENLRIGIVSENWGPAWSAAWVAPTEDIQVTAFFADGNTNTESPTFTERFEILAASPTLTLLAPRGATSFRIIGRQSTGHADSPFTAGITYLVQPLSGGFPLDEFEATYLEQVRLASVPFPASATSILVSTPGIDVVGGIEWGLDL